MKFGIWMFAVALCTVCMACWCLGQYLHMSWSHGRLANMPVPSFTQMVLFPHGWLLFCPIPWLTGAFAVTFRRNVSSEFAFSFAGMAIVAICAIASAVAIAAVLPYLDLVIAF